MNTENTNSPRSNLNVASLGDRSTVSVTLMAKLCADAACPTVYRRTDRDTVIVQGYQVRAEEVGMDLPPGEFLVEVPSELLSAAARAMS